MSESTELFNQEESIKLISKLTEEIPVAPKNEKARQEAIAAELTEEARNVVVIGAEIPGKLFADVKDLLKRVSIFAVRPDSVRSGDNVVAECHSEAALSKAYRLAGKQM